MTSLQKWCAKLVWGERHLHQRIEHYGRESGQDLLLPAKRSIGGGSSCLREWILLATLFANTYCCSFVGVVNVIYPIWLVCHWTYISHAQLVRVGVPCKVFYTGVAPKFSFHWGWEVVAKPFCIIMNIEIIRTMWLNCLWNYCHYIIYHFFVFIF